MKFFLAGLLLAACLAPQMASAQAPAAPASPPATPSSNSILLTVFFRHDQSKTLDEINAHLEKTGFRKNFPPDGVEIVNYNIVMGIGQVITLRVPADKLRAVNVAIEKGAWGAYRTEFYATYDYLPIFREQQAKDKAAPK